jgi:hypothetical protein
MQVLGAKKNLGIGEVIAIVDLHKPTFTNGEQVCQLEQQWQH